MFEITMEGNGWKVTNVDNLLLNMSGGLLPENLQADDVKLLEEKYGVDWFTVLGYTEPEYKKPVFDGKVREQKISKIEEIADVFCSPLENGSVPTEDLERLRAKVKKVIAQYGLDCVHDSAVRNEAREVLGMEKE